MKMRVEINTRKKWCLKNMPHESKSKSLLVFPSRFEGYIPCFVLKTSRKDIQAKPFLLYVPCLTFAYLNAVSFPLTCKMSIVWNDNYD